MNNLHFITTKTLLSLLFQQMSLQQQLIEAQEQIIALQKQVESLSPKTPKDKEVFWHVASGGTLSIEAASSDDISTLRKFRKWNIDFAKKHIQPYVNPKVFSECVNQMTRGLSERIAELETKTESIKLKEAKTANSKTVPKSSVQLTLIQ
jgi:hypothetical protein